MADETTSTGSGRDESRPRRSWLTHRPTRWSAVVPVIAFAAGLLFATSGTAARGTDLRSEATGLPQLIRERTVENARTEERLEGLREDVDALTEDAAPGNERLQRLEERTRDRARAAGLTPVRGPAVTVTLDDANLDAAEIPEGFGVNDVVVHQQDVQGVVNALWKGGAEAMQIMDQRVVSTSAVRCVGNTLILQGRVYSPPFTITAIGDPEELQQALEQDPTVRVYRQYVDAVGLGYDVEVHQQRTLPAFTGQVQMEHARAMPEEE